MPNGTRRAHARNGKPVRATTIKHPTPPKKRLTAGARRRAQHKPMLYAAGTLAGLGALDAILTGRWFTAGVLFAAAGGFLIGHAAWSHHKNRQARKPAKPQKAAVQQRREALEKARDARHPEPAAESSNDRGWVKAGTTTHPPALSPTHEHPVVIAQRNGTQGASDKPPENGWTAPRSGADEPTTHAESVARSGHRCDCRKCRADRRAARAEKAVLR